MKKTTKIVALLMALVLCLSFAACGGKEEPETTTVPDEVTEAVDATTVADETTAADETTVADEPQQDAPTADTISAPVDVLNAIWAKYTDDFKFFAMGGDFSNLVDGAPGAYSLEDKDSLASQLICKGEAANAVAEAASLIHAMNANTFTGAAYKLAEGADMDAFLTAIKADIQGNQWICGFPEKLLTAKISDNYVVVAFGNGEIIETFKTNLISAYSFVEPTVDTIG